MKWLLSLFIFCLSVSQVIAGELVSTWDDPAAGLAGWEKATMNTFTEYHDSGGNPGGHIRAYGNLTTGIKNRQPEFTGNYLEKNYNNISLDILVNLQQLANFKPTLELRYSPSFAGWNYKLADFTINAGAWQHFSVYFDSTWSDADAQAHGWFLSSGPSKTFHETLAHVGSISIKSDYPQITSKNLGFDNFMLAHVDAPPPAGTQPQEASQPEESQPGAETTSQEASPSQDTQEEGTTTNKVLQPIRIQPKIPWHSRTLKRKIE
ncbi:MAG: hypothetical protein P8130_06925 [Deltaproteobacteria bacterium]